MKGSLDSEDFEKYEQKSWDLLFAQAKREVLYNAVHLCGQIDILKKRQGADAEIIRLYEDLKDQVYHKEKSFEKIQKSTDELRGLVLHQLKKTPGQ
jgi:formamidopyrimidine-DNA glycosylase